MFLFIPQMFQSDVYIIATWCRPLFSHRQISGRFSSSKKVAQGGGGEQGRGVLWHGLQTEKIEDHGSRI